MPAVTRRTIWCDPSTRSFQRRTVSSSADRAATRLRVEGEAATHDGREVHELPDDALHLVGRHADLIGKPLRALKGQLARLAGWTRSP